LSAVVAMLIPTRFMTCASERHPLCAAITLTFVHYYTLYLVFGFIAEWPRLLEKSILMILGVPLAALIYLALLTFPFFLAMTVIGAGMFCYAGPKRGVLCNIK
jgi:hypothetical protein